MRRYLAAASAGLALAAALSPLAAAPIAKDADLDIRLPPEETVAFRGVVSFDAAGGRTNSMLYQGGVAGLVAGVLTHAALESSAQQAERRRIQEAADKVLAPYAGLLRGYKHRELMERALKKTAGGGRRKLVEASAKPGGAALIEAKPVFFMTQDQSAIVLENELAIYAPGGAAEPAYRNVVKIVSEPKDATNLAEFWLANDGETLKQESAALMAESFGIALDEAAGAFGAISAPHKTVRYAEGKAEKMERAQILSARCDRLLIKTLRESLISVPVRKDAPSAADCSAPAK
jgi:hypothetical protein